MKDFGYLERVPLRKAWADESREFTPWLLANADRLSAALDMDLDLHQAEHPVGNFSLDLIGEDATTGCRVIIENQLERSDHRHLGQLLTYAGGTQPAIIIWLADSFREEHVAALEWLNSNTRDDVSFFAVQIELFRIGDSQLAPHFTAVVRPNEWERAVKERSVKEVAPKKLLYREFWQELRDQISVSHPDWVNARKAPLQNWIAFPTGLRGVHYSAEFTNDGHLVTGISMNSRDALINLERYNLLQSHSEALATAFNLPVDWIGPHSTWSGFNIQTPRQANIEDRNTWPDLVNWIISIQVNLRSLVKEHQFFTE
jgi:hypothetical protein